MIFYIWGGKLCPDNLILSVFCGAGVYLLLLFNVKPFRTFLKNNSIDPASPLFNGAHWHWIFGLSWFDIVQLCDKKNLLGSMRKWLQRRLTHHWQN